MAAVLVIPSCGMTGGDAVPVPAYIYVPSFTFQTDSISQGSSYAKFTDMWISDGGQIVGSVGLPSLLPIQKQGQTDVRIDAGIILTGHDEQRAPYPLVGAYIETRNLKPGVTDTIKPVFKYHPNIDVKFIEDYDRIGSSFKVDPISYRPGDTVIKVNDNHALRPGSFSGKVVMAPGHQKLLLTSNTIYKAPGYGAPMYLEIDYSSNLTLDIGYVLRDTLHSVFQSVPRYEWRKVYVSYTNELKAGESFLIYIAVFNPDNITPEVYFDNIKLLGLKD